MVEKLTTTPEHGDTAKELREAGTEHQERLREELERNQELAPEKSLEAARDDVEKAQKHEYERTKEEQPAVAAPERRRGPVTKATRKASYKRTMTEVRGQMSAPSRAFSKIIHQKVVERTSDFIGATVARPNAILSGSIFAFVITLGIYLLAKHLGYPLSGFESIGAFIIGWIVGVVYDFLRVMITGKR